MKKTLLMLTMASALAAGSAFAAENEPAADLQTRLEAARERLEEAAHEVAELSAEVGKPRDIVVIARPAHGMLGHPRPPLPPLAPGMEFDSDTPVTFMRSFHGEFADMELANLTPQLGRYFGTQEGVLVVRAPQEDSLKLEDGDVMLSIDGREPSSGSHATRILRSYQPGEKITLRVMRQKKALNLNVTLPEKGARSRNRAFKTEEPA